MSPAYKPAPVAPLIKGLVANTDPWSQPKGSFPRGSNMLLTKRGAVVTCDGSAILHAYNGQVQETLGKILQTLLFAPTGVASYYMMLAYAPGMTLGAPQNLVTSDGGTGGSLPNSVTLYYKVTALDGIGGETTASNEASFVQGATAHKVILTWNVVPNAYQYNIYRGTAPGGEELLIGSTVPVGQASYGNTTVTFTDDGTSTNNPLFILNVQGQGCAVDALGETITWTLAGTNDFSVGSRVVIGGVANNAFDGNYTITSITSTTQFLTANSEGVAANTTSQAGTVSPAGPPSEDTTQQIALYKMPLIAGATAQLPVSYTNANIVALFPANLIAPGVTNTQSGGGSAGGPGGYGKGTAGGKGGSTF